MSNQSSGFITWERLGLTLISVTGIYLGNSIQGLNDSLSELRTEMAERKVTERFIGEKFGSLADRIAILEDLLRRKVVPHQ